MIESLWLMVWVVLNVPSIGVYFTHCSVKGYSITINDVDLKYLPSKSTIRP